MGIQRWSQLIVVVKAIIDMEAPVFEEPTKPVQIYYLVVKDGEIVPDIRVQTDERFKVGTSNENIELMDDIEWKMTLHEYFISKAKRKNTFRPGLKTVPASTIW